MINYLTIIKLIFYSLRMFDFIFLDMWKAFLAHLWVKVVHNEDYSKKATYLTILNDFSTYIFYIFFFSVSDTQQENLKQLMKSLFFWQA